MYQSSQQRVQTWVSDTRRSGVLRGRRGLHRSLALLVCVVSLLTFLPATTRASAPGFASLRPFGRGNETYCGLAAADVDGDSIIDLITDAYVSSLSIGGLDLHQNSNGETFLPPSQIASGPRQCALAAADINGDSFVDVIHGASIFPGTGQGAFVAPYEWRARVGFDEPENYLADLNGDRFLDIVSQDKLYINGGAGIFAPARAFSTGDNVVALADMNNDGAPDIISNQGVYGNDGTGNLFALQTFSGGALTIVGIGDMDGDGLIDLVDHHAIYRNIGNGAFEQGFTFATALSGISVGDVDADGSLDIATTAGIVYLNDGTGAFPQTFAFGNNAEINIVYLADINNDLMLDIVSANRGSPSFVYLNDGNGILTTKRELFPAPLSLTTVGDLNADGALDIIADSSIYWNDGSGNISPIASAILDGVGDVSILGVGDLNGDKHLDMFAQTSQSSGASSINTLLNDGNGGFVATNSFSFYARSVVLGDVNGDGALDALVAAGYRGFQLSLWLNDGTGTFTESGNQFLGSIMYGRRLGAFADVNNDGALDIVEVALSSPTDGSGNTVYVNDGKGGFAEKYPFGSPSASSLLNIYARDFDADGAVDVLLPVGDTMYALYRNDGAGTYQITPSQYLTLGEVVAVEDVNRDNFPDFITTDSVYLNDRSGGLAARRQLVGGTGIRVVADMNKDGTLDFLTPNAIHFGPQVGSARLSNTQPWVYARRPGSTPDAADRSTAEILAERLIAIPYTLFDRERDNVARVKGFFSLDGGGTWQEALPDPGTRLADLQATPAGTPHVFLWDTFASKVFGRYDNVLFRVVAYSLPQTHGSYQYTRRQATTLPFRVRGTQIRVLQPDGSPAPRAEVYRLLAGQARGAQPFLDNRGRPRPLDLEGYLEGAGTLGIGDKIIAMVPITATNSYTLYFTNTTPAPGGLVAPEVTTPGVQTITVSEQHPFLLLNLDLSLEWDARNDTKFLAQLQFDLRRASEMLFDWTDGQVALGNVRLFQNGERWDDAHIRVYATNRLRPNANQGGIVSDNRDDPAGPQIVYQPGQVRMGAVWNRYGDASGNLGEDWPRTLAHELGHFALFLDDNYLSIDSGGRLISVDGCPGAMSDPYRDDYSEFHPSAGWQSRCAQTLSNQGSGRSDWATIKAFYDHPTLNFFLHEPASYNENPGPSGLPMEVTRITVIPSTLASETLLAPTFSLTQHGARVQPGTGARTFLFSREGDRLIDLGRPIIDQVTARGARPGDRLCVFDQPAERSGCKLIVDDSATELALTSTSGWRPDLVITPITTRTIQIRLTNVAPGLPVFATLFPASNTQPVTQRLVYGSSGYTGQFVLDEPAPEGFVHLWVEGSSGRQIVSDYALGGSPVRIRARTAPRGGSPVRIRARTAPVISSDGQVIIYSDKLVFPENTFFTVQTATRVPAPPIGRSIVGQGYWLSVSANAPDLSQASLNIGYLDREVPAGEEESIRVYYWNGSTWTALATVRDTIRNEASAKMPGPGLYTLMTSVEIPLVGSAWNLIAYPRQEISAVAVALRSVDGAYSMVYSYEPEDAADPWKAFAPNAPAWVNDLQSLRYGRGYWIYATASRPIFFPRPPAQQATAQTATNSPTPPATYYSTLSSNGQFVPRAGMLVEARIGPVVCGRARTRLVEGRIVVVLQVNAEDASGASGCGREGQTVSVSVEGTALTTAAPWVNHRAQELLFGPGVVRVRLPFIRR